MQKLTLAINKILWLAQKYVDLEQAFSYQEMGLSGEEPTRLGVTDLEVNYKIFPRPLAFGDGPADTIILIWVDGDSLSLKERATVKTITVGDIKISSEILSLGQVEEIFESFVENKFDRITQTHIS